MTMALHRTEQRVRPQMSRQNRVPLADRVAKAAEAALAARHFVSAIDILVGIGWLDLALQLLLWEMSESMGNHDSEVVDASSVD